MGYITFFPKNINDNFQSIPEQAPPEESMLADQQTATNGWTSEQANAKAALQQKSATSNPTSSNSKSIAVK